MANQNDVVVGVSALDELDLLVGNLVLLVYKKYFCSLLSVNPEGKLQIKTGLLDLGHKPLLGFIGTLIVLDHHCLPLQSLQVGLMLNEIFDSRVEPSYQDRVILLHHFTPQSPVDRLFKDLVYFDLVNDVMVLSQEDDEGDEEVDAD